MADTSIEWATKTWNPIVGCSVISPGCTNCYAMRMAGRLERMGSAIYKGLTQKTKGGDVWTGRVEASNWGKMIEPLRWKKPERIFTNSMSDLFHDNLDESVVDQVFAVMALCPQHTFMVLTKRADRMRAYCSSRNGMGNAAICKAINDIPAKLGNRHGALEMPLPNVWLGVSAEDQETADQRIPALLLTPAAKRFVSAEPLLGPIRFTDICNDDGIYDALAGRLYLHGKAVATVKNTPKLDLIITGGESGNGRGIRDCDIQNVRSITRQCAATGVACFNKQMGRNPVDSGLVKEGDAPSIGLRHKKGADMSEWPEDLRVRQMPEVAR